MMPAVAPREGGVDRNFVLDTDAAPLAVAPREGGVDRNQMSTGQTPVLD